MKKGGGKKSSVMSPIASALYFVGTVQSSTGLYARRQIGHLANDKAHLMLKHKLI